MAGRVLVVVICWLALCLPGGGFTLAQGQEPAPQTGEQEAEKEKDKPKKGAKGEKKKPKKGAKREKKKKKPKKVTEEEKKQLREQAHVETVRVTATRVETDLMKTPLAVTVIDQDTLDREGVQNIRDMAEMVPNMDIATENGQSTPVISLRGVRSTNTTELGDPSVGVHLDGIYSPRMQGILGLMFDNEQVEVTRGPQGTLFGRNSTVGSINIVSSKPKLDAFDARLNVQYGNYNHQELQGMINLPVSETFGLRFAGRYYERASYIDGYWDPNQYDQRRIDGIVQDATVIAPGSFDECTSPECYTRTQHSNWWIDQANGGSDIRELVPADDDNFYMNSEEWAYRLSGLWQPKNKKMSLNLSFQHFRSDGAGGLDLVNCEKLRGRPVYEFDDEGNNLGVVGTNDCSNMFPEDDTYQAVVNTPGRFFLNIMYLRSQFSWDIKENLRLVVLSGFEDQDRESAQDMEQNLNAWDQAMFFLPGTGSRSWSNEVQLQSQGNRKLNWIAGVNYFHEKTSTLGYFDNAIDEKALWDQPDRSTDAGALFAQGTYSFTDKWHLTLGMRYSDETKQDRGGVTYLCNASNGCAPEVGRDQIDQGLTGFDRADLNTLPADFFEDSSIYPDVSPNDNKGSWSHTDWRIGLDYDRGDTLLYSYLATGFKAGGIGDVFEETNPRTGELITARTAYEPEEVLTFELGFKQRLFGDKLNLRGAYFYTDYENMQYASVGAIAFTERFQPLLDMNGDFVRDEFGNIVFGFVTAPIIAFFTQNVPGAEIQGFELEYDWRPWNGGRIHGYATWLDTEITDDWTTKWNYDPVSYFGLSFAQSVDPTNPVLEVNMKGNQLAVSPEFGLRMTVEHAFFLQGDAVIIPWVTASWEDDSYLTIWNVDQHTDDMDFVILDEDIRYTDDKREAWTMVHAGVRLLSTDWTAELYVYNLTNEIVQYWGGSAEQVAKGSFSVPRTYGFRFTWDF